MPPTEPLRPFHPFVTVLLLVLAVSLTTARDAASVTLGFIETWADGTTATWEGGAVNSNPGTGGLEGDGYLLFSTPNGTLHNLGTVSNDAVYAGNWTAAGITQVRLYLNDVGTDEPIQLHFSLGSSAPQNFWQYNVAFVPPSNQWAEFVVDLTNVANWTQIIGTGTFATALQTVQRVHIRHDLAPYMQTPDPLDGDVGMDRLLLTNGTAGVPPGGAIVPRALQLAAPAPNPSHGPVTFALEVFDGEPVTIEIVDAAGRLIRRAEITAAGPGARSWTWDGRDAAGRATPAGYYSVRATGAAGGVSRGLVRIE